MAVGAVAAEAWAFLVPAVGSGMAAACNLLDVVLALDTSAFGGPAQAVDTTAVDWRTVVAAAVADSNQAMGEEPGACQDSLEVASLQWAMVLRAYEAVAAGNAVDVPEGVGAFVDEACLAIRCAPSAATAGTACPLEEARLASATEMHETWLAAPADWRQSLIAVGYFVADMDSGELEVIACSREGEHCAFAASEAAQHLRHWEEDRGEAIGEPSQPKEEARHLSCFCGEHQDCPVNPDHG